MGNIDFGKIISAAAVSTLGVLALIVIAVGLLAFYFFKGSGDRTKLTVWLTAVVAAVLFAAAFIQQADRPEPRPEPTETPEPEPTDTPLPEPDPSPTATPTRAIVASPTPEPTTPAPPPTVTADLSGQWHDDYGNTYNVSHYGPAFTVQQWNNGMAVGYGQGSVSGRTLRYGFVAANGAEAHCVATVAPDYRSMAGTCGNGLTSSGFTAQR